MSVALYFAYGSNMCSGRLRERIPDARSLGAARAPGFRFACDKRGKDGSGKANLRSASGASAWGVLFEIPLVALPTLDRFEWGYERRRCRLEHAGAFLEAELYLALAPEPAVIPPFDWYRDHMLRGAREHALPGEVVAALEALPVI